MKFGARNRLCGKITEITRGEIMSKVKVEVAPDVVMCSVMTTESLEDLGVAVGDSVGVTTKAVNVLLSKE